jgi:EmrB/QacA subfamily drug resistance transporter
MNHELQDTAPASAEFPDAGAEVATHASRQRAVDDTPVSVRQFLQLFAAVMLPMFMAAIDQTLLATATPAIAADLGGLRDTTWIALGYLLATMITVPLYGRLGDRFGRKPVLLVAIGVFALGSAACGAAQSMLQLSLARVLQGLGGGGLIVMSQALIGELLSPRQRPRFQGYFAANFTLASILGPVLGGFVVAHASWRWLFLVNLPLTLLAAWRVSRLPAAKTGSTGRALDDGAGLLMFVLATSSALLWLTFAGHRFAWVSAPSALLGIVALTLGWLLVRRERTHATPFLPVELLRVPGVAAMAGTVVLFASCFFACVFFLPIYLQLGAGAGAAHSGLLLLPVTLGMVVGATTTGRIVARTGRPTPMPVAGMSMSTIALFVLGIATPSTTIVAALGLACGVGFGTVMPTAQLTIQTLAGREKLGAAAAVVSLSRAIGALLGTALFGALVYGMLHGVDLDVALRDAAAHRDAILRAFQYGFLAAAILAAASAWVASRLPPLRL